MNNICDIHSHIIPFVDDGASDFNMAIDILKTAYKQGVRNIVCSSHNGFNTNEYFRNFEILKNKVKNENIDINLYSGCEIYCSECSIFNIKKGLNDGSIPTINNTKHILVEFNPYEKASNILEYCYILRLCGYIPIIAHTERHFGFYENYEYIHALQKIGCLFQINAYSICDCSDENIRNFSRNLLRNHIITFVGSDVHRTTHRSYMIKNGIDYIYKYFDVEYADNICFKNAKNMLNIN